MSFVERKNRKRSQEQNRGRLVGLSQTEDKTMEAQTNIRQCIPDAARKVTDTTQLRRNKLLKTEQIRDEYSSAGVKPNVNRR